ncbi:hypothetical protein EDC04DRAFT_2657709, partial [Pisolithus marmoratus]
MNNAAIAPPSKSWENLDSWRRTFEVNLFGYVCVRMIVPGRCIKHVCTVDAPSGKSGYGHQYRFKGRHHKPS